MASVTVDTINVAHVGVLPAGTILTNTSTVSNAYAGGSDVSVGGGLLVPIGSFAVWTGGDCFLIHGNSINAIAGPPAGSLFGAPAVSPALSGFGGYSPRTMYSVYDELNASTTESPIVSLGTDLTVDTLAYVAKVQPSAWYVRLSVQASPAPVQNYFDNLHPSVGSGRHTMFASVSNGLTDIHASVDSHPVQSLTGIVNPPALQPNPVLFNYNQAFARSVLSLAYTIDHSYATAVAVMKWTLDDANYRDTGAPTTHAPVTVTTSDSPYVHYPLRQIDNGVLKVQAAGSDIYVGNHNVTFDSGMKVTNGRAIKVTATDDVWVLAPVGAARAVAEWAETL